uniref:Sugar phosphate transporter domain-containing protein n=1 Tax=Odontella aurita TaxID=265563 RepID=A0A7S4I608_9STRA|mmetsp:Transcript_2047/g.5397  ORF Transcript_2047/g.5397 Transcript_2047/m.5397 type:complete len:314 (+) Transcript_2047:174-1115(+)
MSSSKSFVTSTPFAVAGYMLCSATLLISNKYAVYRLPAPSFILFAQLFGTAVAVQAAKSMGKIECDKLESSKVKAFLPVALIFLSTIFLNMKSLQYANVETFMVFRFSTPLCICVADYLFLGRQLPCPRSWASLVALLVGAIGYAKTDGAFQVKGYAFCALWYAVFCLDQIYLKHVTNTVKMDSNWGRVYYSNLLASIPLVFTFIGDPSELEAIRHASAPAMMSVALSVALGAAMSYFAWMARSLLSATSFTVVGNTCKLLTILINMSLWDKHASQVGIVCLIFCLAAAYFYKQAPMRLERKGDENKEGLLPK